MSTHDLRSGVNSGPELAAHTLGPIAAKTVDTLRQQPDMVRRHIHAVIAAQGEARAALHAYEAGWIKPDGLAAKLRDILAICEAAGASVATTPPSTPAGVELQSIGTRHAVVAVQQPSGGAG